MAIFNENDFLKYMLDSIDAAMTKAAEPVIQQALKEAEEAMREKLAAHILAMHQHYSLHTSGQLLTIQVNIGERK